MSRMRTVHPPVWVLVLCLGVGLAIARPASALPAPPPNDDVASAHDFGSASTASASGTNLWATAEADEPDHWGTAKQSVWYRWTAPQSGVVAVNTCKSNFDTVLAVYRGAALGALGRVVADDDSCGVRSRVRFFAVGGTTYQIAVDGLGFGDWGSVEVRLRVESPPINDSFGTAEDLGGFPASASGTNADATPEAREPSPMNRPRASVWYRWTASASRQVQAATCGSPIDTVVAVYTGSALDALRPVASDDDSCGVQSVARFKAVAGTTYQIAVDAFRRGTFELRLEPSNAFRFAAVKRNPNRGTARLIISVPNAGDLSLAGTRQVRRASSETDAAGRATLAIRPTAATQRALATRGSARVTATVTFTPEQGSPNTQRTSLTLVKHR